MRKVVKKYQKILTSIIFLLLFVLGVGCVAITPILEKYLAGPMSQYGDTPIGHLCFVVIRVINVVIFPVKLSGFTTIFNRAVGFRNSVELSFVIQSIGGTIIYFLGRSFRNKIYVKILKFPFGKKINSLLKQFQHLTLDNKLNSILFFTAFSYEPFGYLAGMKKMAFWDYYFCLLVSGSTLNLINISRDMLIGTDPKLALLLQVVPYFLAATVTCIFLRENVQANFRGIKKSLTKLISKNISEQKPIQNIN